VCVCVCVCVVWFSRAPTVVACEHVENVPKDKWIVLN
jgi:hypothetical protein